MVKKIAISCLFIPALMFGQKNDSLTSISVQKPIFQTSSKFVKEKLMHYSPEELWETYYDGLHTQIEAGANLSKPDEYINSVRGASYLWNQYYYNDFPISSLVKPGSSIHKMNMYKNNFNLFDYTLDFMFNADSIQEKQNFMALKTTIGGIGGRFQGSNWFVNNIMNHSSAQDRQVQDFHSRRRTPFSLHLYQQEYNKEGIVESKSLLLDLGNRKHLNFGIDGLINDFTEQYVLFTGQVKLRVPKTKLYDHIELINSVKFRDQLNAEFNYGKNETGTERSVAFSAFASKNRTNFHHTFGFNYNLRDQLMNSDTIYRNVIDQDGESFEPYMPNATFNELQLISNGDYYIKPNTKFSWDVREQIVGFNPHEKNSTWHSFSSQRPDEFNTFGTEPFISLNTYSPESESFVTYMPDHEISIRHHKQLDNLLLHAQAGLHHSGLISPNVTLNDISLDFRAGLKYQISKSSSLEFNLGKQSLSYTYNQIQLLERKYLSGNFDYWLDNGDEVFTDNERGSIYDNTSNIEYSKDLGMAKMFYLELPFIHQSRKHMFAFTPQFKTYRDTWKVNYKGDSSLYGVFGENSNAPHYNEEVFELTANPNYIVEPQSDDYVGDKTENTWLFNQPFFAGTTAKYAFQNRKIYMSISISAYMVVGSGNLGNDLQSNSVGNLSLSSANPNTSIMRDGRLHSDRAFLVRYLFSKKVNDKFSYSINVKYKDGEPFSTFFTKNTTNSSGENQIAIWNQKGPGDNPFTGIFNKREDAYYSVDCRFNYKVPLKNGKSLLLNATVYNALDFGLEINEYTFRPYSSNSDVDWYNNNSRAALEIQNPRTIEIGASYHF